MDDPTWFDDQTGVPVPRGQVGELCSSTVAGDAARDLGHRSARGDPTGELTRKASSPSEGDEGGRGEG